MVRSVLLIFISILLFTGCRQPVRYQEPPAMKKEVPSEVFASETHQAFFSHLMSLCGNAYSGTQVYRSPHGSSWEGYELIMYVNECNEAIISVPFRVGDDRSRTWLFMAEDGMLRFRHDHRHADGTPEDETLYGGYADDHGTAFVQYFPADDYTANLIEGSAGNVWTITISEDLSVFSYRLERDGEPRFSIDFDLTSPLNLSDYE